MKIGENQISNKCKSAKKLSKNVIYLLKFLHIISTNKLSFSISQKLSYLYVCACVWANVCINSVFVNHKNIIDINSDNEKGVCYVSEQMLVYIYPWKKH